jgi:hypothetical protein
MVNDIIVLDNVIPLQYQDAIEQFMLSDGSIPWYLQNDITYADNNGEKVGIIRKYPAFAHVFKNEDGLITQKLDFLLPLVYSACDKIKFNIQHVFRVRSFLQLPTYLPSISNNPHIDMPMEHLVCLYYVNDSQGPTTIYQQTLQDVPVEQAGITNFTAIKTVDPVKGRCVFFSGAHYHSSSSPVTDKRCIINFDLI